MTAVNRCHLISRLLLLLAYLPGISGFLVVYVPEELDVTTKISVQACVGLYNRREGGSAYTVFPQNEEDGISLNKDEEWLRILEPTIGNLTKNITDPHVFLKDYCLPQFPCFTYSYQTQQPLLPNVITLGAVMEAIPVDPLRMPTNACKNPLLNALDYFQDNDSPYLATALVYNDHVKDTSGLAMLTPGYQHDGTDCANPPLNEPPEASLVDFVFS